MSTPLSRSLRGLALFGTLALLIASGPGPVAAATREPRPTPTSETKASKPSPTPKATPSSSPKPQPAPTPGGSEIGKTPIKNEGLRSRTAQASKAVDPASLAVINCAVLISGPQPTCAFDLWARAGTVTPAQAPGMSAPMPVWGFSTSATGPGLVPGPTLIVRRGQQVRITLHNQLDPQAGNLSLEIPAAYNVVPDLDGIASGLARMYNFPAFGGTGLKAGTYLYQAGPTPDAPRQILMGLSGLLIVRPAEYSATNTSAYGNEGSEFQAEATLEVNEFDSAFNSDPFGSDPTTYEPDVFLVNGRAFDPANPTQGQIEVLANTTLLLRYANLGNHDRGFTVLNHRQRITSDDSNRNFSRPSGSGPNVLRPANVATKWLTPGQVADSFVTVDPQYLEGTRIPVFESGFHLANADGSTALGGMLTSLLVHGLNGSPGGPITSVAVSVPTIAGKNSATGFTGTQALTFSGTITSPAGAVLQVEWFVDTLTAPGSGRRINAAQCAGGSSLTLGTTTTFSCTIPADALNALMLASAPVDGDHVIWVHGRNSVAWGVVAGDVFTYNITGPDTGALSVHVTPTNGARTNDIANGAGANGTYLPTSDLVLLGTSTQSLADWLVLKAEYCLDSTSCPNGLGMAMYTNPPPTGGAAGAPILIGPDPTGTSCAQPTVDYGTPGNGNTPPDPPGGGSVVAFCGFVPAATLNGLSEGVHTLYAHAYEAPIDSSTTPPAPLPGRWGDYGLSGASIQFVIDRTGPITRNIKIDPSPNNGRSSQSGNLNFLDSLQVAAQLDDTGAGGSTIATAEVFVTKTTQSPATDPGLFTTGTGATMIPEGAQWDATTKTAWAYIPLAILTSYPDGPVRFWVHAQDLAGNWGAFTSLDLIVDRTAPAFDHPPTPDPGSSVGSCGASCTVNFGATDPGAVNTNIVSGEWFLGQDIVRLPGDDVAVSNDPGQGKGIPFSIASPGTTVTDSFTVTPALVTQYLLSINAVVTTLPPGTTLNITFRVRDAAGNWSNLTYVVGTS